MADSEDLLRTVNISFETALFAVVILVMVLIGDSYAESITLYDGALGTTPDKQGWLYITDPLPPPLGPGSCAMQSASGNVTNLDTTCNMGHSAGYFTKVLVPPYSHPLVPELHRSSGFTLSFEVHLVNESHNHNDRSGLSVLVITHDLKGIELGVWADEIWAQADTPLFTHGEGAPFETTRGVTRYDLAVLGDDYYLSADGLAILNGPLRDYTAFGKPYDIPDFLFLGDDTSSASASIRLASVAYVDRAMAVRCDINGDGSVNIDDAIVALQVCVGISPSGIVPAHAASNADVNGDGKIGLPEIICVLQQVSDLR
jgi:hypothetical protein